MPINKPQGPGIESNPPGDKPVLLISGGNNGTIQRLEASGSTGCDFRSSNSYWNTVSRLVCSHAAAVDLGFPDSLEVAEGTDT